ncbi:hypothetical protein BG006_002493 [Podila minutissima]|uniref:Uncharacterized protein n=1 Tax=Podila minutissima TaxID=64525 RepID=A0A9P5SP49_9FUNG|nr:hypothetical protein BG006_002493 [Podila minutissima]
MSNPASVSQYYRKKLEQHELTPEEWVAVRYAVIKHTTIGMAPDELFLSSIFALAAATTMTLGSAAFFVGYRDQVQSYFISWIDILKQH